MEIILRTVYPALKCGEFLRRRARDSLKLVMGFEIKRS